MRLLVVSSVWPSVEGGSQAANFVCHSILSELVESGEFELSFIAVGSVIEPVTEKIRKSIHGLENRGVKFLTPYVLRSSPRSGKGVFHLFNVLFREPEMALSGYADCDEFNRAVGDLRFDVVLVIWSEVGANMACKFPALRFAYHGNPEPKVFEAQYEAFRLTGTLPKGIKGALDWVRRKIIHNIIERGHISIMRRYDYVGDVAENDAEYYKANRINAEYICNMWPMTPPPDWKKLRDDGEFENPGKIVGSVGLTSGTGNTLGFIALGREVLPALREKLPPEAFQIHVYGGGKPRPFVRELLSHPEIHLRGFVDDLDAEILSAPVFLISNNHHRFKVGHTRFLHAWSLGACVVAFADCREAMPEIRHGHNALLGETAEEVADLVARALADRELRRTIGAGGIETLATHYAPAVVAQKIMRRIKDAAARR